MGEREREGEIRSAGNLRSTLPTLSTRLGSPNVHQPGWCDRWFRPSLPLITASAENHQKILIFAMLPAGQRVSCHLPGPYAGSGGKPSPTNPQSRTLHVLDDTPEKHPSIGFRNCSFPDPETSTPLSPRSPPTITWGMGFTSTVKVTTGVCRGPGMVSVGLNETS